MIRDWAVLNREVAQDFKIFKIERKKVSSPRPGEIREAQAILLTEDVESVQTQDQRSFWAPFMENEIIGKEPGTDYDNAFMNS